jgi:hypothetical protein
LLQQQFGGGMPRVHTTYSPSDHISVTTFSKQLTTCSQVNNQPSNCVVEDSGSFFATSDLTGIAWFLSFRGSYMWDIVNMRRNTMTTLVLVSLCAQCAASEGPWRNFVSLRFAISRLVVKTRLDIIAANKEQLAITGTSMGGQMAQFATAFLSVERAIVSQNAFALVTHGSPRVANRQLARKINSGLDVPYVSFALYRDIAPHYPPLIFGFRSGSPKIMWLFIEPWFAAKKSMGDDPHLGGALRYKEFAGNNADEEFAHQIAFMDIADHLKYFMKIDEIHDLAACGGMEDKFFLNTRAVSLFDAQA